MERILVACIALVLFGCKRSDRHSTSAAAQGAPNAIPAQVPPAPPPSQGIPSGGAGPFPGLFQIPGLLSSTDGGLIAPVVNWRSLVPFLPDRVGDFIATEAGTGGTRGIGSLQATHVYRTYRSGNRDGRIEIYDAPVMRVRFSAIQGVFEDTPERQRRGLTVRNYPAMLTWDRNANRSRVEILVGNRYMFNLEVWPAAAPDEAVQLAGQLDLSGLAAVR